MKDLPEFEELAKLAKENPEELERIRKSAIENLIQSAPKKHQRRLRGLQFQVDMERQKAKNPMESCVRVSRMMHNSFSQLRDALNEAQQTHVAQLKSILNQKAKRTTNKDQETITNKTINESKTTVKNIIQFPKRN